MKWVTIVKDDYSTYPKEGYDVVVKNGINYDIAWYVRSGDYEFRKCDMITDECDTFNQFEVLEWSYIDGYEA